MSYLGDRLREERDKKGWSQVLVANKLGLKRSSTYANWEYGTRQPDIEMLNKLASLYEVTVDSLTGNNNELSEKERKIIEEKLKLADIIWNLPENEKSLVLGMIKTLQEKQEK